MSKKCPIDLFKNKNINWYRPSMKSISSNIYTRKKSTYGRRKIYSVRKKERRGTMAREKQRVWNANKTLQLGSPAVSCVCVYSLLRHTLLCAPQRSLNVIKDREKNIFISIFFFFCVFIYLEMIVPGTAGGQGPLGSPGGRRLVSVCCAVWGPLWLYATSNSLLLRDSVMWGTRRKKVKRERPRNRFLFFSLW